MERSMIRFAAGFFFCYLAGALPMGIILARMDMPVPDVIGGAATWPNVQMRVALHSRVEVRP
jgi:hypothetical protein